MAIDSLSSAYCIDTMPGTGLCNLYPLSHCYLMIPSNKARRQLPSSQLCPKRNWGSQRLGNSLQGPWLPAGSWSLCPLQHSIQLVPAQITKLKRENHTQPQTLRLTGSYLLLTPHTTTRMWTETIWFQKWVWILELGWGESWYHTYCGQPWARPSPSLWFHIWK